MADEDRQVQGITLSDAKDFELKPGEFRFNIELAKATTGDDGALYVEGEASDTGLDLQGERISLKGQETMVEWVKSGEVILGGEADHYRQAFDDDLGQVVEARVLDGGGFFTKSRLFDWNDRAKTLHKALESGVKLGQSVYGNVTHFHREGHTPVIDGVALSRIMVTSNPVNTRTWLGAVAKSLPAPEAGDILDETTAKGLFIDALRDWQEEQAALTPWKEQMERINAMGFCLHLLNEVAYDLWDRQDRTAVETVNALSEAIDEAKTEIMAKAMSEAGDGAGPDLAKEVMMEIPAEGTGTEETTEVEVPQEGPINDVRAVRVARSFAEAAKAIMSDEALEPVQQREALAMELVKTASAIDEELPEGEPTGEEIPVWASRLQADLSEVKAALETLEKANVGAGPEDPETGDRPVLPERRSLTPDVPDIGASRVVAAEKSLRSVVEQMFGYTLELP